MQDPDQIASNCAAQASIVHLENFFFGIKALSDKGIVDAYLSAGYSTIHC